MLNTVEHLKALGIRDHWLEEVAERVAPLTPLRSDGIDRRAFEHRRRNR